MMNKKRVKGLKKNFVVYFSKYVYGSTTVIYIINKLSMFILVNLLIFFFQGWQVTGKKKLWQDKFGKSSIWPLHIYFYIDIVINMLLFIPFFIQKGQTKF